MRIVHASNNSWRVGRHDGDDTENRHWWIRYTGPAPIPEIPEAALSRNGLARITMRDAARFTVTYRLRTNPDAPGAAKFLNKVEDARKATA